MVRKHVFTAYAAMQIFEMAFSTKFSQKYVLKILTILVLFFIPL